MILSNDSLRNSGMLVLLNKEKIPELHKLGNFIFIKNSELRKINEKLVMTPQFDLTRIYDVIIRNSFF